MDAPPSTISDAELLQTYLATHDAPCPVCKYNLRSLESQQCPECGAALDLRVGSDDLRLGPWIMSLLGVMLPLGFTGFYWVVLTVIVFISLIADGGVMEMFLTWGAITIGVAFYAAMLWVVIRGRRRLMKRKPRTQWIIATCWLIGGPLSLVAILAGIWFVSVMLFF